MLGHVRLTHSRVYLAKGNTVTSPMLHYSTMSYRGALDWVRQAWPKRNGFSAKDSNLKIAYKYLNAPFISRLYVLPIIFN